MSRTKLTLFHGANHDLSAYVDGSETCLHKLTTAMVGIFPEVPSINTTLYSQGSINILSQSISYFLITATKIPDIKQLKRRKYILIYCSGGGDRFITARWAWQQACEVADHLVSTVRKQRECWQGGHFLLSPVLFSQRLFTPAHGMVPYTFRGKLSSQTYPDVCLCNLPAWSVSRVPCPFKR